MRASAVAGIVFANTNDNLLNKLTSDRSMASVPFGGRYRLIDFTLSNLVNAGVSSVGLITKENYHSLMDHIGSGVYWDLDRKNGGIYLLPPYLTRGMKRYTGTVDALMGAVNYIDRCGADYMVICNSDVIANVDMSAALESHISTEADITIVYSHGKMPHNNGATMQLLLDENRRVKNVCFEESDEADFAIGVCIIQRQLLLNLISSAYEDDNTDINRDIIAKMVKRLNIYGYEHKGFAAVLDGMNAYFNANMQLLDSDVRAQLFNRKRPIFTKTRDDMPTRYGTKSSVNNCIIADGCVIDGTVKNSILFRGVKVEKGAVVENCILMQSTSVGSGAQLNNVISDKNAVIGSDMILKGTAGKCFFVKKNQIL